MIKPGTADLEHLKKVVEELKNSFEKQCPEISKSPEEMRSVITAYDIMLLDYFANPPKDAGGVMAFLGRHLETVSQFSPTVDKAMRIRIVKYALMFREGPKKTVNVAGRDLQIDLDDYLLLNRNFVAVYLGDPIRSVEFYSNPQKTSS